MRLKFIYNHMSIMGKELVGELSDSLVSQIMSLKMRRGQFVPFAGSC